MPLLPPLALALFAAWAGTLTGGASWAASAASAGVLLVFASVAGLESDPLRLGRAGRVLTWALVVLAAAAWLASPVPRAGRTGLVLGPAWLLTPIAVARCWPDHRARRRGLMGVAVVTGVVAAWALLAWWRGLSSRPALPLGHHGYLALWLAALLPLAVLPARRHGPGRLVGLLAGGLGGAVLLVSGSLAGRLALAALAGVGLLVALRRGLRRTSPVTRLGGFAAVLALLATLMATLIPMVPRIGALVTGTDTSLAARRVYWEAGWRGIAERPAIGWGPGAVPWTIAEHLAPRPAVNPPGELVGELHSLPLQLGYELGLTGLGLVVGIAGLFVAVRLRAIRRAADPALVGAALAGLLAAGIVSLAVGELRVTALPLAVAVTAGAALAGQGSSGTGTGRRRWFAALYVGLAVAVLWPGLVAAWRYERALVASPLTARRELTAAVALDPAFPLYRARLAWAGAEGLVERRAAARAALRSAEDGVAVAPLWLAAGVQGVGTASPWSVAALARACRLDPLSPFAPFLLARHDPTALAAPASLARALLADPRLLATRLWEQEPGLRTATLDTLARWPGVDPGWKESLIVTAERVATVAPLAPSADLLARVDVGQERNRSFSLALFRRPPAAASLARIEVDGRRAVLVDLPAAFILPESSRRALEAGGCTALRDGPAR